MLWGSGELELPEEMLDVLAPRDVFPCLLVVDDVPHPRRQVAWRDRQQSGGGEMLVQHDVSGERLYQPNEVERHGRHQRVAVVSIPRHPSNAVDHIVQTVLDSADGSQQLLGSSQDVLLQRGRAVRRHEGRGDRVILRHHRLHLPYVLRCAYELLAVDPDAMVGQDRELS